MVKISKNAHISYTDLSNGLTLSWMVFCPLRECERV